MKKEISILQHWATTRLSSINSVRRKLLQNLAPPLISHIASILTCLDLRRGGGGGRKGKWSGHYEQRSVSAGCPQGSLGSPAGRVTPRVQACHYCSREQNTLVSLETEEACNNRNAHNYMITNESMDLERLFVLTDSSSVSSTRAGREFLLASW